MIPGRIANATMNLGAPDGWDELTDKPCSSLPVRAERIDGLFSMLSAWIPTPEQIARLQAGAPVLLRIWDTTHPVVSLDVGDAPDEPGSPA